MIELEHLVKNFGDLVAVNDVSLKIGRGEFFAPIGTSPAATGGQQIGERSLQPMPKIFMSRIILNRSLDTANSISAATAAMPRRKPISCTRSFIGRPRTAS